jgi:hypothetical protein
MQHTLNSVISAVSLEHVQDLTLECGAIFDSPWWTATFGNLVSLVTLELIVSGKRKYGDMVSGALTALQIEPGQAAPLPQLQLLRLHGLDFFDPDEMAPRHQALRVDHLIHCLQDRRDHGHSISAVHLSDCYNISNRDVELMNEQLAPIKVTWDSYQQKVESDASDGSRAESLDTDAEREGDDDDEQGEDDDDPNGNVADGNEGDHDQDGESSDIEGG